VLYSMLLKLLQKALSDYQAQDSELPQQLKRIQGKLLKLTLAELPKPFYLLADQQLTILASSGAQPDAEVSLSLASLPELAQSSDLSQLIKQDKLSISGDGQLAAKMVDLLRHCQFAPEEWLAGKIGDAPAHLIHRNMPKLLTTGKRWKQQTEQDLHEWLQDEAAMTPTETEVAIFKRKVSDTQQGVDQLEQRIQRLCASTAGSSN